MSPWFAVLILLIGVERLAELAVARANLRWSLAHGGTVSDGGHYPLMVALHTGLLAGCLIEATVAGRPFVPALGWPMLALVVAAQGLRWWCVGTLGRQWNTRVVVVPGLPRVTRGPYRPGRPRHPNYIAVAVEGVALPLVHTAWLTAAIFTAFNAALMVVRIRCEEAALAAHAAPGRPPPDHPPPHHPPPDHPPPGHAPVRRSA